jgi:hypothetical protein
VVAAGENGRHLEGLHGMKNLEKRRSQIATAVKSWRGPAGCNEQISLTKMREAFKMANSPQN